MFLLSTFGIWCNLNECGKNLNFAYLVFLCRLFIIITILLLTKFNLILVKVPVQLELGYY